MRRNKYFYSFRYDKTESELCRIESKSIFCKEEKNKLLVSALKVEPSCSAFIKSRIEIISFSENYTLLLDGIKKENICIEGFKVEYIVFEGDSTKYVERLEKLKDVGYSIVGIPDYYKPIITYALCYYKGVWCFGILVKNNNAWYDHKQKPHSYSNSIGINIAKALVNIAANANKEVELIDVCCGVGTIMLEACFAGYNIEGCDINLKICNNARENISYFNYTANVYCSDIKDISKRYGAAIIDLPYNLLSYATNNDIINILSSTALITDRLVIVSTSDISNLISNTGLRISDYCQVNKRGKRNFNRKIWVCEMKE